MDKILSARVDESIIQQIGILSQELGTTKKAIIEAAIQLYSDHAKLGKKVDIFENTFGAWKRSESPEETIKNTRSAFNQSMKRHHL